MRLSYTLSIVFIAFTIVLFSSCNKKKSKSSMIDENNNSINHLPQGVKLGEMKLNDKENNIINKLYFPIFTQNDKKIKLEPINDYISLEFEKYKTSQMGSNTQGYLKIRPDYLTLYKGLYSCSMKKTFTMDGDTLIEFHTLNYSNYYHSILKTSDILNINQKNKKNFLSSLDPNFDTMSMERINNIDICFYNDSMIFSIPSKNNNIYPQTRYIKSISEMRAYIKNNILRLIIIDKE